MARARADDEMGVGKLALRRCSGHRKRRRRVVVTPHELDRASHRSERVRVVLGERSHENVAHDAGGGAVVVRAVTLAQRLEPFLGRPARVRPGGARP